MNFTKLILAGLYVLIFSSTVQSQGYLKVAGKKIIAQTGEEVILRGIGLGGWMLQEGYMLRVGKIPQQQHKIKEKIEQLIGQEKTAEFYQNWLANHTRKIDIDSMAAWGFNSVRLPIHYNLYTLPIEQEPIKGQNTWLEKGFAMTDSLLDWCKANKMYLILDLHAAPGGQGNDLNIADRDTSVPALWQSEENQQKTIALWRKLAQRYVNEPYIGLYDLINEPNWGFEKAEDKNGCNEQKNEALRKLMIDITQAIREVDKKHIIAIEGNCWGNNYNGIFPLWDNNTIISFHKYWNYNDKASIQKMLDIREQYNVPLWLGESGENSNLWFRDAIRLVERHGIGWAWWPLKKIGFNNPLEIKLNPAYQKVLDYWNDKGERPSTQEAELAFRQLAEDTKLENCIYHADVVDAMIRQVHSTETKPFRKHQVTKNKLIYAVEYDLGSNGMAYFDKDTANYHISTNTPRSEWNKGRTYRNDGVDIQPCQDTPTTNGYHVAWIEADEWLQYTLMVRKNSVYTIRFRVASDNNQGRISLMVNDKAITQTLSISNTGGFHQWQTIELKNIRLKKGKNILRVRAEQGGFNFNYLQFVLP